MKKWIKLLISILIPVGIGFLSSVFTGDSTMVYGKMIKPFFAPPAEVFPVVWTILYVLMGISAYLVFCKADEKIDTSDALSAYIWQLFINFSWSIIFFKFNLYWASFVWLLFLIYLIIKMIKEFSKIDKTAGYLQIPYLIWVIFAGILNLAIAILN